MLGFWVFFSGFLFVCSFPGFCFGLIWGGLGLVLGFLWFCFFSLWHSAMPLNKLLFYHFNSHRNSPMQNEKKDATLIFFPFIWHLQWAFLFQISILSQSANRKILIYCRSDASRCFSFHREMIMHRGLHTGDSACSSHTIWRKWNTHAQGLYQSCNHQLSSK